MSKFNAIFLVDDDPVINLVNKRLLKKTGISDRIEDFLGGEEALEKISDESPSDPILIFLDINMPVLNGWEFLNKYMLLFPERNDQILILSSSIDYQDRQKAKEFKIVSGFLEKPLTLEKISTYFPNL
jgi:CheY-like chemotaxis protein